MKSDTTTKFLLATIAVGLFLNFFVSFIPVAAAAYDSVWVDGGSVDVSGSHVRVSGEVSIDDRFDGIRVYCTNCN